MAPTLPARTDDGASRRGALARRLVELRETGLGRPVKGLALASAVGTSRHSLWEWEHGRHIPREQALDAPGSLLRPGGSRRSRSAQERAARPSSRGSSGTAEREHPTTAGPPPTGSSEG